MKKIGHVLESWKSSWRISVELALLLSERPAIFEDDMPYVCDTNHAFWSIVWIGLGLGFEFTRQELASFSSGE